MKVLALSSKDAPNIRLAEIISKLLQRGHEVALYGTNLEEGNIRMFSGLAEVHPVEDLKKDIVALYDVIFCTNDTVKYVKEYKKYIFLYNYVNIFGTYMSDGGDFMFLPNGMRYMNAREHCATMIVGDPQYENIRSSVEGTEKNILFIDCGHYPFGRAGKETLARLIVEICVRFPEYTIKIKPRFLEDQMKGRSHNNHLHLYECIRSVTQGIIPGNLCMLNYHEEMDVLLDWAGLVICPYTSVYIDAIARDKKLLVISGLPNEDSLNLNNGFHWKTEDIVIQRTGCLVDYREIFKYLPEGLYCYPEEKQRLIPFTEGAALRIAEVMEFVWNNMLVKGRLPERKSYQYFNYQQEIGNSLDYSWDELLMDRERNLMVYRGTRRLGAISYPFDISHYVTWVDSVCDKQNPMMCSVLEEVNWQYVQYMFINKQEELSENAIAQSYLMDAYFTTGRFGEFEEKYLDRLKCKRAYPYYKGIYELSKGNYKIAESYLDEYILNYGNFEWEEYIPDHFSVEQVAINERREIFPFSQVGEGEKVVLYGAGALGKKYWMQSKDYCDILCIADKNVKELFCHSIKIIDPGEIANLYFHKLVICLRDEKVGRQVKNQMVQSGIPESKIIYR